MAEWLPKYLPGQRWTSTASATITGGQLLAVSGSDTVGPAGANSIAVVGVAAHDAASGEKLTVFSPKIAVLTASGAITAGAQVVPAAAGAVSALAAVTTPTPADVTNSRAIVGVALTTAASNLVKVLFTR
jgi:Uncharacterized conserved protein (DUF2190)